MALTKEEALEKLCNRQWPAIDRQVAEDRRLPSWKTLPGTRQRVYDKFCNDPSIRSYDARKPLDRQVLAEDFRRDALLEAKRSAQVVTNLLIQSDLQMMAEILGPRKVAAMHRKLHFESLPNASHKRPTRLQRFDDNNLKLVSFVVERITPFGRLLKKRLNKHGKDVRLLPGYGGPKVALFCQALADEWNPTHPGWPMSSGDVLMAQFYRAADRVHLCHDFLHGVKSEIEEEWEEKKRLYARIGEAYANLSEAERATREADGDARLREWEASPEGQTWRAEMEADLKELLELQARFSSDKEYAQRRAKSDAKSEEEWRASLTRRDMIHERVMLIMWRLQDENLEGEMQLWQSPLRDWFLPEARGEPMRFHRWGRRRLPHRAPSSR